MPGEDVYCLHFADATADDFDERSEYFRIGARPLRPKKGMREAVWELVHKQTKSYLSGKDDSPAPQLFS